MQGGDDFVVGGFDREVGKLVFEENEAKRVFEDSTFRVGGKILFQIECLHALNDGIGITHLTQNFTGAFGVKAFQVRAPFEITGPCHGIGMTRNFPAAQMLAACGEAKFLRGVRAKLQNPRREPLRVEKFARMRCAVDDIGLRVAGIFPVETPQRGFETRAVCRLEFCIQALVLLQN